LILGGCVAIRSKVENPRLREEAVEAGPCPNSRAAGTHFLLSLVPLVTQGVMVLCYRKISVLPHVGRGMSTVTTRSEQSASSRLMGNSSGTRYTFQSAWSSVVPCRETSHKSSAVRSPTASMAKGHDAFPQRGSTRDTSKRTTQTQREMVVWLRTTD
jgi:hypothetical protein